MIRPRRIALAVLAVSTLVPAMTAHAEGSSDTTPDTTVPVDSVSDTTIATTTTSTLPPVSGPQKARINIAFARIVLSEQRAYFYTASRRLIATLPVSTGSNDQTPVGTFKVFSKSALAFFTPAPNERMRYMTRFTKGRQGDNIGFHGIPFKVTKHGEVPFYTPLGIAPVSHGCIRMRVADAKWVFENMKIGSVVAVVRSRG
jgi:lipoprotein-anchoring transpeptidase ErfK/SrfK